MIALGCQVLAAAAPQVGQTLAFCDHRPSHALVVCTDQKEQRANSPKTFVRALHTRGPIKIRKVLTDRCKDFTNSLFASQTCKPPSKHEFNLRSKALGNEHRRTDSKAPIQPMKVGAPQTPNSFVKGPIAIRDKAPIAQSINAFNHF